VIATHYEVLGIPPNASQDAIRVAYRERARVAHPDRAGTTESMVAINEAYRVLADPGRRAVYDRALTTLATIPDDLPDESEPPVPPRDNPLSPAGPARFPWKLMAVAAVIGSAAVLISSVFSSDPKVAPPDGIIGPGSCIAFEPNGDAREVTCGGGSDDIVVKQLVPLDGDCPTGTVGHRDRQGLGVACVAAR
jgi:DnaJ-like protein